MSCRQSKGAFEAGAPLVGIAQIATVVMKRAKASVSFGVFRMRVSGSARFMHLQVYAG